MADEVALVMGIKAARRDNVCLEPVEKVSEPARGAVRLALRAVQQ